MPATLPRSATATSDSYLYCDDAEQPLADQESLAEDLRFSRLFTFTPPHLSLALAAMPNIDNFTPANSEYYNCYYLMCCSVEPHLIGWFPPGARPHDDERVDYSGSAFDDTLNDDQLSSAFSIVVNCASPTGDERRFSKKCEYRMCKAC
ncbi:hypothetical protein FB45DRAFT_1032991 [Roridomyces roridus]|uniref:Uncharacterized protein n=1 Tax=Roridomyces roridus TaxID=1738132 RepID=A0AAD7FF65_9AGAR|nr:hypothetical protein FB45DRAFT_1032991 [Roridomyces roridus]